MCFAFTRQQKTDFVGELNLEKRNLRAVILLFFSYILLLHAIFLYTATCNHEYKVAAASTKKSLSKKSDNNNNKCLLNNITSNNGWRIFSLDK